MLLPDLPAALLGFAICPVVFLLPGYAAAYGAQVLSFRHRTLVMRVAIAILVSFCAMPAATYLTAKFGGRVAMWLLYAVSGGAGAVLVGRDLVRLRPAARKMPRAVLYFVLAFVAISALTVMDIQWGHRLLISVTNNDYVKHVAVTSAVTRTGIPPVNPCFYPHHPVPLVYYYFWFMMASLVDQLGGSIVTARAAVISAIWWTGLGVGALVVVYVRMQRTSRALRAASVLPIALLLLFANGLDVIPVGISILKHTIRSGIIPYGTVEWWNEQVTSWFASMIWVPHHVAGFLASMTALLVIRYSAHTSARRRWSAVVLAGLGFASAAGLSVWVTVAAAFLCIAWGLVLLVRRMYGEFRRLAVAGAIGGICAVPFLLDLAGANHLGRRPIAFTIRDFYPVTRWLDAHDVTSPMVSRFARLATLPVNYGIELGFYGIAGVLYLWMRRRERTRWTLAESFETAILAGSLFVATFLKSTVKSNDLGWRAFLPAQFILLLWAARYLSSLRLKASRSSTSWWRQQGLASMLATATLAGGFATTVLDISLLRASLPFAESTGQVYEWIGGFLSSRELYYAKQAYASLEHTVPVPLIVQHNPLLRIEIPHGIYWDRQVVAADDVNTDLFGTPPSMYAPYKKAFEELFVSHADQTAESVNRFCDTYSVSALFVKDSDEAWQQPNSWVYRMPSIMTNQFVRVIPCGKSGAELAKKAGVRTVSMTARR